MFRVVIFIKDFFDLILVSYQILLDHLRGESSCTRKATYWLISLLSPWKKIFEQSRRRFVQFHESGLSFAPKLTDFYHTLRISTYEVGWNQGSENCPVCPAPSSPTSLDQVGLTTLVRSTSREVDLTNWDRARSHGRLGFYTKREMD